MDDGTSSRETAQVRQDVSAVHDRRAERWAVATGSAFDVAVVGGGISGAVIYDALCRRGVRTVLLERGDFGGGTSQTSAMMVWGGLLYLATMDVRSVVELSLGRDRLVAGMPEWIKTATNRYVIRHGDRRGPGMTAAALWLYWCLGGGRRTRPVSGETFPEAALVREGSIRSSWRYQEATVVPSDARFVLHWILSHDDAGRVALNYAPVVACGRAATGGGWRLAVRDRVNGREGEVRAGLVVNAAGVWADELNRQCAIATPYRHAMSKGVFIALPRPPVHTTPLTFENEERRAYSLIPWGPVSLWGPTDSIVNDSEEGFAPAPGDVRRLLASFNRVMRAPAGAGDIVAVRCGIRPLAVRRGEVLHGSSRTTSRRHVVWTDPAARWVSVFGGKLTGCAALAAEVVQACGHLGVAGAARSAPGTVSPAGPGEAFPGMAELQPSAVQAASREMCCTVDDYLRRRTNISQWIPREGLGRVGQGAARIAELAALFPGVDGVAGPAAAAQFEDQVRHRFDAMLAAV